MRKETTKFTYRDCTTKICQSDPHLGFPNQEGKGWKVAEGAEILRSGLSSFDFSFFFWH